MGPILDRSRESLELWLGPGKCERALFCITPQSRSKLMISVVHLMLPADFRFRC
jgi:hypothetical protein